MRALSTEIREALQGDAGVVAVAAAYLFWRLGCNKYSGVGH